MSWMKPDLIASGGKWWVVWCTGYGNPNGFVGLYQAHTLNGSGAAGLALSEAKAEEVGQPWTLLQGGNPIFTMPRSTMIRSYILNHIIHHRAHLCVYLRLNEIPVPGMYGPSGDE